MNCVECGQEVIKSIHRMAVQYHPVRGFSYSPLVFCSSTHIIDYLRSHSSTLPHLMMFMHFQMNSFPTDQKESREGKKCYVCKRDVDDDAKWCSEPCKARYLKMTSAQNHLAWKNYYDQTADIALRPHPLSVVNVYDKDTPVFSLPQKRIMTREIFLTTTIKKTSGLGPEYTMQRVYKDPKQPSVK
jgi:hypothetical protein